MNDYHILAKDYDYLNPREEIFKQRNLFENLVRENGVKTCLDCACGTGWHLYMLRELGLDCYGSDLSEDMLSIARVNLKGLDIPLKREDFRTLENSWDRSFDMVICVSALPHMLTDKDVVKALTSMRSRLRDNGVLVIINGIDDNLIDNKPKFLPGRILSDQAFYFFLEYPTPKKIVFNILHVKKTEDSFEHAYDIMEHHAMRKSDLDNYLYEAGSKNVQFYGGYEFSPYSKEKSGKLIAVAKR